MADRSRGHLPRVRTRVRPAAHILLRGDALSRLINKKPEKFRIEWTAARSYFPGVVAVEKLTLRGQSGSAQWYLAAERVRGRISLWRLALKTVHLRSARTSGLDFRLRRRLDRPSAHGEDAEDGPRPTIGSEHYPEIPGFANPPDQRPEDLYPAPKKLKKAWVIDLGGVEVQGPVRVAVNRGRLEGEGAVSGAMTYRLRDTIELPRGNVRLPSARLFIDSEVAIDELALDVASRWRRFPAKGARLAQIFAGISGSFAIAGDIRTKASVPLEFVPGLPVWATGRLDCRLRLEAGALQPGSSYALRSDILRIRLLDLAAVGSAGVTATTRATEAKPLTELAIDLDSFTLLDPADDGAVIPGLGFLRQRLHLDPQLWPETIRIHGWYDPSNRGTGSRGRSDVERLPQVVDTYLIQGDNLTIVPYFRHLKSKTCWMAGYVNPSGRDPNRTVLDFGNLQPNYEDRQTAS